MLYIKTYNQLNVMQRLYLKTEALRLSRVFGTPNLDKGLMKAIQSPYYVGLSDQGGYHAIAWQGISVDQAEEIKNTGIRVVGIPDNNHIEIFANALASGVNKAVEVFKNRAK